MADVDPTKYLRYNGERVTDEPYRLVRLPLSMLDFVLGATDMLVWPSSWDARDDVDEALAQMSALRAQFLEGEVSQVNNLPWGVLASAVKFDTGCGPTRVFEAADHFCRQYQYTNPTVDQVRVFGFPIYLLAGDYVFTIIHDTGYNRGKILLASSIDDLDGLERDCYTSSYITNVVTEWEFNQPEDGEEVISIWRNYKNASSTHGYLNFAYFGVRYLGVGE